MYKFLRVGPCPRGAPSVPPFSTSFSYKTVRTKEPIMADEGLGGRDPGSLPPQPSSAPIYIGPLDRAVPQKKMPLKTPYKFKTSHMAVRPCTLRNRRPPS